MYVYGDSLKSCLVAIVVIEKKDIEKFAKEFGIVEDSPEDLAKSDALKSKILELFLKINKSSKFNSLEKIRGIHISLVNFSDLGLTTNTFKIKRNDVKTHFKKEFDKLYEKLY